MDRVDQDYVNELQASVSGEKRKTNDVSVKDDGTTLDDIEVLKYVIIYLKHFPNIVFVFLSKPPSYFFSITNVLLS